MRSNRVLAALLALLLLISAAPAALMEAESLEGGRAVEIIDAHLSNERQKPS